MVLLTQAETVDFPELAASLVPEEMRPLDSDRKLAASLVPEEMGPLDSNRKVAAVDNSILATLVCYASLLNLWEGRSSGSCQSRSLVCLLLPGRAVLVHKVIDSSNR